ncbi:MAG: hypothetical protein WCB68_24285 [Pyrinomonadaceae bacterium]
MSTYPNQKWLDRSNSETLDHLERQGRTGIGLYRFSERDTRRPLDSKTGTSSA